MAYAQAKKLDAAAIPIVDITALRDGSDPQGVAEQLHAASQNLGFIYIKGHGIPEAAIENARATAYEFFRSNDDEKSAVKVSSRHRGWLGHGGAKMQDDAKAESNPHFLPLVPALWQCQSRAGAAALAHQPEY